MGNEKDIVMEKWRKEILLNTLMKGGVRYDERTLDEFRRIEIQKGILPNAEGSALVKIGKTQVLVGVKFDTATPFSDRPTEGVLAVNAELLPLASPNFETGPPDANSIELARIVDRAVRSSEMVDLKSFFIEEGKVLALYLDIYVLDHHGNFIDAATLAAVAALTNTRLPKVEGSKIVRGESTGPLPLRTMPVSTTFIRVGNYWLLDPALSEEQAMDGRITLANTPEHLCAIQKGKGSIGQKDLERLLEISFKRGAELRACIQA